MSALLAAPFRTSPDYIEGIVTVVNPAKFSCSVKTISGKIFPNVVWLLPSGGGTSSPKAGDSVVVLLGLSYPVIIGSLPPQGLPDEFATQVSTYAPPVTLGGATNLSGGFTSNATMSQDFLPGDQTQTTPGGGVSSIMREGTFIARASQLAQIVLSKFEDIVRIVGRNFERMSDFDHEAVSNAGGRLFKFWGFNKDFSKSKLGIYNYTEMHGDTQAAQDLEGEAYDNAVDVPAVDTVVRKYRLVDNTGVELMVETLDEVTGKVIVTTKTANRTQVNDDIKDFIGDSAIEITPSGITLSKGESSISITSDSITLTSTTIYVKGILNSNTSGSTIVTDNTSIRMDIPSGHYLHIDPSGIHSN